MENKIKLYDELKLRFSNHKLNDKFDLDLHQFSSHDMIEFGKQLLKLAANNAKIIEDPNSYCGNTGSEYPPDEIVSKQSILNTINQVE